MKSFVITTNNDNLTKDLVEFAVRDVISSKNSLEIVEVDNQYPHDLNFAIVFDEENIQDIDEGKYFKVAARHWNNEPILNFKKFKTGVERDAYIAGSEINLTGHCDWFFINGDHMDDIVKKTGRVMRYLAGKGLQDDETANIDPDLVQQFCEYWEALDFKDGEFDNIFKRIKKEKEE